MGGFHDSLGLPVAGATPEALTFYDQAVHELQCFTGDPVATIDKAIEAAPDFVMAHVFKGGLFALSTDREALAVARESAGLAGGLNGSERERAHVAALGQLAEGRWHGASEILEDLTIEEPRDVLALMVGHQVDFFTGNARLLRDRIARAMPMWSQDMPGYHAMLAMQAFGFEETADYGRAEAFGRRAIELQPRNGWAQHAVAHVMEMQSRQHDGIAWMRGNEAQWTKENFLQVHNWWHLALFHYDLGETDEMLALYDGPIYGERSPLALNMVDASALLWRLYLGGVDVGDRWRGLAANWAPKATAGNYAFNDAHAMMAFVGAGLSGTAEDLLAAQRDAMSAGDDNSAFTRDVGHPVCLALKAFGAGDYVKAAQLLRPVCAISSRFGGSHAQRDVLELTLIEAALRSGQVQLARALTAERHSARPDSPLSALFVARAAGIAAD
ncbi:MAG: tetratricopeptide repeat protein [Rhizobiaceae bacterium]|nr:tetratricopeptide repeat protein [Rhizobiaceae bacterium]